MLVWENLGLSCSRCNNVKRAKWSDDHPIVSPFADDPAEHLRFAGSLVIPLTERGSTTEKHTDLNRTRLVESRAKVCATLDLHLTLLQGFKDSKHRTIQAQAIRDSWSAADEYIACWNAALDASGIRVQVSGADDT